MLCLCFVATCCLPFIREPVDWNVFSDRTKVHLLLRSHTGLRSLLTGRVQSPTVPGVFPVPRRPRVGSEVGVGPSNTCGPRHVVEAPIAGPGDR